MTAVAPERPRPTRAGRPSRTTGSGRAGRTAARASGQREPAGAVGKAYARRARRAGVDRGADRAAAGRSRFVLLVMVLLGSGLVASLWLSTTAAADSYRLDKARLAARELSERSELLRMDITSMESAPALARSARQLGMVPASDVARLVARPDGSVQVVGTPKAAVAPAPPPAPAQPAPSPSVPTQNVPTQNAPTQNAPSQPGAVAGTERGVSAQ